MLRVGLLVFALVSLLATPGCFLLTGSAEEATLISVEIVQDPVTGRITRLSHWQYSNGDTVTTSSQLSSDASVTDRRNPGRAPTRVTFQD